MKTKKRAIATAVCLLASLLLLFLIWVDNSFGRHNMFGASAIPAERMLRQLMLEDAEEIFRGEDDIRIYDGGKYMLMLQNGRQNFSLCEAENDAAFFCTTALSQRAYNEYIDLPICAYTRDPKAASAEMELFISSDVLSADGVDPRQERYSFPAVPCEDGTAFFRLEREARDSGEAWLISDFKNCLFYGSIANGIYYRAELRFYDTDGALISESIFEMGKKES